MVRKLLAGLAGGLGAVVLLISIVTALTVLVLAAAWGMLWIVDNPDMFQYGLLGILCIASVVAVFVAGAKDGIRRWEEKHERNANER